MESFTNAIQNTWNQIALYLPQIFSALLVLIIGIIIAIALGKVAERLVGYFKADQHLEKSGMREKLDENNVNITIKDVVGGIVRWFFYLVTFVAVADILSIPQLSNFLLSVVYYIPNVIVAIIILAVGIFAARFIGGLVRSGLTSINIGARTIDILTKVSQSAFIVFAVMAALIQLGVAPSLIQILFAGFVVMLAIAGGLAFGLGGKDKAHDLLEDVSKRGADVARSM